MGGNESKLEQIDPEPTGGLEEPVVEESAPIGQDSDHPNPAWRCLRSRVIHTTPFLQLREDEVLLPNGHTTSYGVVETGECVGILPFVDAHNVALVRQYRYIAQCTTWEMPTGGVHDGESMEAAAQRELAEEAGFRAKVLTHVCSYHTSKSSIDETAHLFIGEQLVRAEAQPDVTEQIERVTLPFAQVLEMVLSGEITDSMTIIAVLIAARSRV